MSGGQENPKYALYFQHFVVGIVGVTIILGCTLFDVGKWLPFHNPEAIVAETTEAKRSAHAFHLYLAVALIGSIVLAYFRVSFTAWLELAGSKFACCVIIFIWMLNSSQCMQDRPFGITGDPFHEGEYLAYNQMYRQGGLQNTLVIHGPFLNIGPGLLVGDYQPEGKHIAQARAIRSAFSFIALLGLLAVIWQLLHWLYPHIQDRFWLFLWVMLGIIIFDGILYASSPLAWGNFFREVLFYPLLALQLYLWRKPSIPRHFCCSILVGILLVVQLFVSYERAIGSFLAQLFLLMALFCKASRLSGISHLIGTSLGIVATLIVIDKSLLQQIFTQMGYWSRFGDVIFGFVTDLATFSNNRMLLVQLLFIFITIGWWIQQLRQRDGTFREWVVSYFPALLLYLLALLTLRRFLSRSDDAHVALAGMSLLLAIIPIILHTVPSLLPSIHERFKVQQGIYRGMIVLLLLLVKPTTSPLTILAYTRDWRPNEAKIDEKTKQIIDTLEKYIQPNHPTMYTMDSAGIWYYLTRTKPPTHIHQVMYAKPNYMQQQIIDAIEKDQTPVLLLPPLDTKFDGILIDKSYPNLWRYIEERYEIVETVAEYRIAVRQGSECGALAE